MQNQDIQNKMQNQDIQNQIVQINNHVDNDYVYYNENYGTNYCANDCIDNEYIDYDENTFMEHQTFDNEILNEEIQINTIKEQSTDPNNNTFERYFELYSENGEFCGRYRGNSPIRAASKAYTKLLLKNKNEGNKIDSTSIQFYLKESTKGSNNTVYAFKVKRIKLNHSQKLLITDPDTGQQETIVCPYNYQIILEPLSKQMSLKLKSGSTKLSQSSSSNSSN